MKRVSSNSHRSPSFAEEAKIRHRHECLMQDYLDLQKEFVSKKKKLKSTKQKRETLLAEVRFLRHRQAYLLKMGSSETEIDSKHQNFDPHPELNEGVVVKVKTRVSDNIRIPKKTKNCLINAKRQGKKKISVQDQVVLEA